jgi:hypothetical protein
VGDDARWVQAQTTRPGVWRAEDGKYYGPESHPNFDPTRLAVEQVSEESDIEIPSASLLLSTWLGEALNADARLSEAVAGNGATAPLLVLSCSTFGSKSLDHGSGRALFVWKRRLIQEHIGSPWSTEELWTSAEHRVYLNFFSRLCLVQLVMPEEAEPMTFRLWQLLNERAMQGRHWRLPDRATMQDGVERLGRPDVTDLTALVESTGLAFARLSEDDGGEHGSDADRSTVARLAMQAFVLGELLPFISGSATLGSAGSSGQLRREYEARQELA